MVGNPALIGAPALQILLNERGKVVPILRRFAASRLLRRRDLLIELLATALEAAPAPAVRLSHVASMPPRLFDRRPAVVQERLAERIPRPRIAALALVAAALVRQLREVTRPAILPIPFVELRTRNVFEFREALAQLRQQRPLPILHPARLRHPRLAQCIDAGGTHPRFFLLMLRKVCQRIGLVQCGEPARKKPRVVLAGDEPLSVSAFRRKREHGHALMHQQLAAEPAEMFAVMAERAGRIIERYPLRGIGERLELRGCEPQRGHFFDNSANTASIAVPLIPPVEFPACDHSVKRIICR